MFGIDYLYYSPTYIYVEFYQSSEPNQTGFFNYVYVFKRWGLGQYSPEGKMLI